MPYSIKAEKRDSKGKTANRGLRRNGLVPAVLYGRGEETLNLTINDREFTHLLEKIKGHSPIIDMDLGGETIKCVIKLIQRNPISMNLLHVDFQKIHAQEKISVAVPVILKGTDKAAGVKAGGILEHHLREVPIRAQLDKIPEHVEIDITELKLGHSYHISDLKVEGVEFTMPQDTTVVSILAPRKVEEVVAPVIAEEELKEPEVITEKKEEVPAEEGKEKEKEKKSPEKGAEKEKEAAPKKEKK